MLSPSSPALVEAKVNEQMERFLMRQNTSQRQLVSRIDSKVVLSELIYLQKFKKPKKIVIPEFKTSIILNLDVSPKQSLPELPITKKFKRKSDFSQINPAKLNTQLNFYPTSPVKDIQSPSSPTGKMLSIYQDLVNSIKSNHKKKLRMVKTQRKIKTLSNEIKVISGLRDDFNVDHKKSNKKFERQYMKESLKEMESRKRADTLLEYQINRFTLSNRTKHKIKSLY